MTESRGFAGNWTYRSFDNTVNPATAPADLMIAAGTLTLEAEGADEMAGHLSFSGFDGNLNLTGIVKAGHPPSIRLRATGVDGTFTAGWVYDYLGYLVPPWPNGVGERQAFVGSMIRVVARLRPTGEVEWPAGEVASFLAVSAV